MADASDPGLIEPADGIGVLRNHGSDPRTMQLVWTEWGNGSHWLDEAWALGRQLQRLLDVNATDTYLLTAMPTPLPVDGIPEEYRVAFDDHGRDRRQR